MVATTSLTLAGVAVATIPANAVPVGAPSFATSAFTVAPGDSFDVTLDPTFNGSPSWYYGSRAYLDTETCGNLPTGLSYIQDNVTNGNGIAPTYQIAGTVDPMVMPGDYTVCFYTEQNPEGWATYGTSQPVTITVLDAGIPADNTGGSIGQTSPTVGASQATVAAGQSTTITPANAPEGAWVAWFIDGEYVDGAPASSFPQTKAYADFTFANPAVSHTVTWALYETAPFLPVISDPNLASVDVTWEAQVAPAYSFTNTGVLTADEPWTQEATYTVEGFDFSEGGEFVMSSGDLPPGISYVSGFADGKPTLTFSGTATSSGAYSADFVLLAPLGGYVTQAYTFAVSQSHNNTTDTSKVCEQNWDDTSHYNLFTDTVTWEDVCMSDGTISDVSLENTLDAYDTFGNIFGYNQNGSTFTITAEGGYNESGNVVSFTDYNVWSYTANEFVDVVVERTFVGNTVTWDVKVFSAETINPSTLPIAIDGNLGSDDTTTYASYENGILTSNDGFYGDPALLWNGYGATAAYEDGYDVLAFEYGDTSHAVLQNVLVDYAACSDNDAIIAYVDSIANDWEGMANTNLTAVAGLTCIEATPADFSGTQGEAVNVTIDITTAGSYDWSAGAYVDVLDLPEGLSYEVIYDSETGAPIQLVITGTPVNAGSGEISLTIADDYWANGTITIPYSIAEAAVVASFDVNGATFQATVEGSADLTPSNTVGFDFAEGGNIVVSGLPVGISYVVNNAGVAGVIPTVTLSGATETESDYTIVVTLTDNFGNEASSFPIITVTAAPAPTPSAPTFIVGGDVAFMAEVESEATLTIIDDANFDWTNGGTIVVAGLPAGLNYTVLNANTPGVKPSVRVYGTATTVGVSSLTLTVTDGAGNTADAPSSAQIIKASTSADLGLEVPVGGIVAGSESFYVADGLLVGANWTLTVRSTPQVIASGTVPVNGSIGGLATIPAGLESGWHSLTLVSTDYAGNSVSKVVWFEISANGTLVATSNTEPSGLAYTGSNIALTAGGAIALLVAGAGVMLVARRRKVEVESN